MSTVRLNITIPEELARQLDNLAGSRKKSQFITESLQQRIENIQKEEMQRILEEGYRAGKQESLAMAREFEPVDLEGWDEY